MHSNTTSSPDYFGETFTFNLIKQNVRDFSFIFLAQIFCCPPEKLKFKLLLSGTVSFSTSYQRCLIRHRLLISAPSPPLPLPLLHIQPQQMATFKYIIPGCIGNEMLLLLQIFTGDIKKEKLTLSIASQKFFKETVFKKLFSYEHSNIAERDEWIRLLNKFCWLKMQVLLTFFTITIWNIHLQSF